jgi:hypothetical protein
MEVDVSLLQVIVSMVLPLVVGIVIKQVAHPAVKSIALAFLSAIAAIATAGLSSNGTIGTQTIVEAVIGFIIAVGTYYGLWKPTGIAGTVNTATENFGITIKKEA